MSQAGSAGPLTKAARFRRLLTAPTTGFLCEAHNGLSAKIVEEAGFPGIWGSGLAISSSMGLRDNNEASWTQVLEAVEFMCDATSIPLLLDGDTGYGNFNNVRRLVRKLEQRGVAAVCIEDKLFPKTNSFIDSEQQPLADIGEFCGRIKAAKDAQGSADFSVVARVEALIAGWGLAEALKRAEAYRKAGADAVLIHSKLQRPDEILAFCGQWAGRLPVVIVPTTYYSTPVEVFEQAGVRIVIWANMIVRSAVKAMQRAAARLERERSIVAIEDELVPVKEIFRLQGAEELRQAEERYLPTAAEPVAAVVLAASRGAELALLTEDRPKALLEVGGKALLDRQLETLNEAGIKDITIVRGYLKEQIAPLNAKLVDNDRYDTTKEAVSLHLGLRGAAGRTLVSYGDILYKKYVLTQLLEAPGDLVLVVDADWRVSRNQGRHADYVSCDPPYRRDRFDEAGARVTIIGHDMPPERICGEWIGLLKASGAGLSALQALLEECSRKEGFAGMRMTEVFAELLKRRQEIRAQYIRGHWIDVDDISDLRAAGSF